MDIGIVRTPIRGEAGLSAYDLALAKGFEGTLEEWLNSLKGERGIQGLQGSQGAIGNTGAKGDSSYDIAVSLGYEGTIQEWYDQFKPDRIMSHILNLSKPFVSVWDTRLISTGSSNNNQIRLPLLEQGSYNFYIDWGDGNTDYITEWNQPQVIHTYVYPKEYLITIRGSIRGWRFNNSGDRLKLQTVEEWGNLTLITNSCFYGCTNLNVNAIDIFNTSQLTNFSNLFYNCTSLTNLKGIRFLNTSQAVNMNNMFRNTRLNEDLSNLDFSNVTFMQGFLQDTNYSTENYDKLLISLSNQSLQQNVTIDVDATYTNQTAKDFIINTYDWTINDNGS